MKIVVCVKQVAVVAARSGVDPAGSGLLAGDLVHTLNPYDEVAVEEALRTRETFGGTVTVLTLGLPRAEEVLRWCLAMGADEAVHIVGESLPGRGPWAVSAALAEFLREREYDLVLCGKMSIDEEMGQTGTIVAELLGLPVVTAVARIEWRSTGKSAVLQRSLDRGDREVVECPLPAVFTADRNLNRPRYPTLRGRRTAERQEIPRIGMARPGGTIAPREELPAIEIVRLAPPKIRPRKILSPDENASAAGRMQWILSGGMAQKKGARITGDAARIAEGILDFLRERNLLPGPPRPIRAQDKR